MPNLGAAMAATFDPTTPVASFHHGDFSLGDLVDAKGSQQVSVCIPARDEERTIFGIVDTITRELVDAVGLVDEVLVVDDSSTDRTAELAFAAGASLVRLGAVDRTEPQSRDLGGDPQPRTPAGKGSAMRAGVAASRGDVVVFLDGDVENFAPHFVAGLLGPALTRSHTVLVKGCYRRPIAGAPSGGGRVTELVARPLLALLFPELSGVVQPLAGETAIRREALAGIDLAPGYGVELAMLIDVTRLFGVAALAQVDLDVRIHRNRPLHELGGQAREVLEVALARAGVEVA